MLSLGTVLPQNNQKIRRDTIEKFRQELNIHQCYRYLNYSKPALLYHIVNRCVDFFFFFVILAALIDL